MAWLVWSQYVLSFRLAAQVNGAQAKIVSIEKDQRDHSKELERSVEDLVCLNFCCNVHLFSFVLDSLDS